MPTGLKVGGFGEGVWKGFVFRLGASSLVPDRDLMNSPAFSACSPAG